MKSISKKYKVGVIGCGNIFARHLEAINSNPDSFELVALCDINEKRLNIHTKELEVRGFTDYKEMLKKMKGKINLVVIATPNSYHYEQAIKSLESGCDVLVEKPVDFVYTRVLEISDSAKAHNKKAYAVLQVRYNNTLKMLREALKANLLGKIRSVSLIQRWQRPPSYFESWRADKEVGGRSLYEVGIHYMDIVQWIFGLPSVIASSSFSNKHTHVPIEDTVFALLKFPSGASGSLEVTIAAEPSNLECSIAVLGSEGYIKIGGRALDMVESYGFLSVTSKEKWEELGKMYESDKEPNSYGMYLGSCPNHPTIYSEIAKGRGIDLKEAANSIKFIQDVYRKELK